ncbi:CPBP family intramembrane metalloprotease [Chryseobacterium sp. T16E-39]|uniref:CPBP family intramembrane glutamic endopeptidase n=1 Tax=Chryseobacterium sp. T16E-39 TaxID=2015076 RepID=UPI000B5B1A95|nr:CPBP family intramembrane glutamic endopeptidase [Chryseobacterium sp. T16E-39]ASK31790.1 CPBP family intramembrane metalloprotease [Chryseobacterium sp. T16E-39]
MIGIIAELIISWFLLWIIDRKNLSVLGFKLYRKRIHQLGAGFLLAVICCSLYHLMSVNFTDNSWVLNKKVTGYIVLISLWFTVKSVLFEELIFRGALLYLAIEKLGIKIACILSAVSFGIYHWFSYNAFGNPFQMGIIFSMTAIFGWILAYAFAKTGSLYLPIGLHLGWNLINIVIFSNGPLGDQILVKANENKLEGLLSLFVFIFQILALPVLTYWYLRYIKPKTKEITS